MTNHDEPLTRMGALFDNWLRKHHETGRTRALGVLKGQVGSLRATRQRTIAWANKISKAVERAREELGGSASLTALAEWLNDHGHTTSTGNRFASRNMGATLFSVDKLIAADAVMECRAKMSALALSASFAIDIAESRPLEVECIERIKAGIVMARALERRAVLPEADLTREAQHMAIAQAELQRSDSRYAPMLARECYLTEAEFAEAVPDIEKMIMTNAKPDR